MANVANRAKSAAKIKADETYLSVAEFAKRLGLTRTSAYKLVANEPGVLRIRTEKGSAKPIIRVPLSMVERIVSRSVIRD